MTKNATLQDIQDAMTPEQKDFQALIVGAAIENENLSGDASIVSQYEALTDEHKLMINFLVGNILVEEKAATHSVDLEVDEFLKHFGVKGMKWGVIRDFIAPRDALSRSSANTSAGRAMARAKVKGGGATLGEAHLASLKSNGHRALNAFTGDRTFWRRTAVVAGVAAVGVGVSVGAPLVLPAATLISVGQAVTGVAGVGGYVATSGGVASLATIGQAALFSAGLKTTAFVTVAATSINVRANTNRAIFGNARINESYSNLGAALVQRQTEGTSRVNAILRGEGSIRNKDLAKHDGLVSVDEFLAHAGVKGMKWGVRKDERALSDKDKALNMSQRTQVKVASTISALAATGMALNATATLFTLQSRFEQYRAAAAILDAAENHPLIDDATREGLRQTKNHIMQGIVGSAMATTAVSIAIGIVTQRTAKAYFAPMHYVYGNSKPKINAELKTLSKDIKAGKRPKLTVTNYNKEVAKIVEKHMTSDKKNLLHPFHELARQQLGLQYNTKKLNIKFEKLPNTDLYSKMTVVTPDGLKLIKAVKNVEHSALYEDAEPVGDIDLFFDYKFDSEGFIEEWSCPTLEVANEMIEGKLDLESLTSRSEKATIQHTEQDSMTLDNFLTHHATTKLPVKSKKQ